MKAHFVVQSICRTVHLSYTWREKSSKKSKKKQKNEEKKRSNRKKKEKKKRKIAEIVFIFYALLSF